MTLWIIPVDSILGMLLLAVGVIVGYREGIIEVSRYQLHATALAFLLVSNAIVTVTEYYYSTDSVALMDIYLELLLRHTGPASFVVHALPVYVAYYFAVGRTSAGRDAGWKTRDGENSRRWWHVGAAAGVKSENCWKIWRGKHWPRRLG